MKVPTLPVVLTGGSPQHQRYSWTLRALVAAAIIVGAYLFAEVAQVELWGNQYTVSISGLQKVVAYSVAILGLQVVLGYTGQVALGHSFFVGSGAYVAAWLTADAGWPVLVTIVVVFPFCFALGVLLGMPALRTSGLYLALVTLGLAAVFPSIIKLDVLEAYTNGVGGKSVPIDVSAPGWLPLVDIALALQSIPLVGKFFGDGILTVAQVNAVWRFLVLSAIAAMCFVAVSRLMHSRVGRALLAIRDNETAASVQGVAVARYKMLSFGLASALGGVAGVLYVVATGFVSTNDFTELLSIYLVVGLIVGGKTSFAGAALGGVVIVYIPAWATATTEVPLIPDRWLDGPTGAVVLAALLIALVFVAPRGIAGALENQWKRVIKVVPGRPDHSTYVSSRGDGDPQLSRAAGSGETHATKENT